MTEILEQGDVAFFVWPARGEEEVTSLTDVQRFFLVLRASEGGPYRRLVVGQKKLPDAEADESPRFWGFVDRVSEEPEAAVAREEGADLSGPPARAVGEGVYAVVRHEDHTDLVYALVDEEAPAETLEALRVGREGSFVLSIKNPEVGAPAGAGLEPEARAVLPDELRERFGDHRWVSADPASFLDHEGVEFLLVARGEWLPDEVQEGLRCAAEDASSPGELLRELRADA